METTRKPYQGVINIICFNWHFYTIGLIVTLAAFGCLFHTSGNLRFILICVSILTSVSCLASLLVSHYIYDLSDLFRLNWLDGIQVNKEEKIANISAGFDETGRLFAEKYPNAKILQFDFYNAEKHTEISIERARKLYPPDPSSQKINTHQIKLESNSIDKIMLILAAHEIRNPKERVQFFCEIRRILKKDGTIIVTEHLRDIPNFLAFNIGFFHFYSKKNWLKTFNKANLTLVNEIKITPYLSTFILKK
ncbi:class I SAM-dependent methyltransferase [Flavobacterium amniphilum]|uniref:methyltransferase domain-containing protein n=1 Tax=Flavobacterium amniphilum TaxID=1834035 RepID=UPI00202A3B5A|nr:methyltransferase domain-containing protein [Flavobacterium amniphilum]MCL9805220.1 class I SAM-dependent methyltransferase [Flavobacterium amniphilum]